MDSTDKLRCSEETDFVVLYYDQSDIEEIDENEDHSVKDDLINNLTQPEDANTPSSSNQIDELHSDEGHEIPLNIANGAYQERVFKPPPYPGKSASEASELGSQSIFFIVIVFGVLIFIIYLFRSPPNAHEPSAPFPPPGFISDYLTGSGYNDYTSGPSCGLRNTMRTQGEGPGFRTGFMLSDFCGYSSSRKNYNSEYSRTSSDPFIPPGTVTEIKTGYAITKRR
ncbi:uncharacterized protein LOC128396485 [Panonychus citri]|uniref:uncharacterized protein LOC128396485 n=1 Tax=Panonychus citri TaxID=50023 RepID=UPI002306EB97|nr:uncharacterized protein LOC128396485 [Panonychus citri]